MKVLAELMTVQLEDGTIVKCTPEQAKKLAKLEKNLQSCRDGAVPTAKMVQTCATKVLQWTKRWQKHHERKLEQAVREVLNEQ